VNTMEAIGDLLLAKGLISADQLRIAAIEQAARNEPLGRILVRLGFLDEATLRGALSEALAHASVDLDNAIPDPEALALVPLPVARRYQVVPLAFHAGSGRLQIATADPHDLVMLDQLATHVARPVLLDPLLAGEAEIARAIDGFYGLEHSLDKILHELETREPQGSDPADARHPLVRLVDALVSEAIKQGASDIHLEPEASFLRVRYRIDGVLRQVRSVHRKYAPSIAVRVKVMAGLNIAEARAPQDGRISLSVYGRPVDLRVSTLPTLHGENIVLRILDRRTGIVPLDALGLPQDAVTALRRMMARPEGLILITGPTGSGKTTTLYSMLSAINSERINIMTLEDPVEYPITGLRQAAVGEASKLDFPVGVRALLRQDPDVLLIGEIRDRDTAEMALRAALTGHQVYATLHSASAVRAIPRLLDLGLSPPVLAGNLIGVVAQRLLRRLCVHCRVEREPNDRARRLLGDEAPTRIWHAAGCVQCGHTGYRGRLAVMELLRFDAELEDLAARNAGVRELHEAALRNGFVSLADAGLRRVRAGDTSLDELARVVDLTSRG
jgi:type II secretory ATPase GspE/PulE/Tfp pilus assembly ATPase PilB-like protein